MQAALRRLRALAERIEREGLPRERAAAFRRALDTLERALGGPPGDAETSSKSTPAAVVRSDAESADVPAGTIRIWSDGSCSPNPGAGGWGTIVEAGGRREELSGASPSSTNNIMEMTAAIEGLRRAPPGATVQLVTDSRYLADGATRWLAGWKRKGWRKADGKPVLNRKLWETLDALLKERTVHWKWVRGHAGHPENERCDQLANAAREGLKGVDHWRQNP